MHEVFTKAYEILSQEVSRMFETSIKMLPKVAIALLIFCIFYFLAKFFRNIAKKIAYRLFDNPLIIGGFSTVIYYGFLFTGLFSALSVIQLRNAVTSLLAGAGVIGLALSFAFQDLATNLISGIFIIIQKPFTIGDFIETNNNIGTVKQIGLRTVSIEDVDGENIIIPSKDIFQNTMTNYSSNNRRRINLKIGVSYGEDLRLVKKISIEAISKLNEINASSEVMVHYCEFGDSSINLILRFWINKTDQRSYNETLSKAIIVIKESYDEHHITIPFPIRTLDFGIKGGEKLSEVLPSIPSGLENK